jgi:hypothetical protein
MVKIMRNVRSSLLLSVIISTVIVFLPLSTALNPLLQYVRLPSMISEVIATSEEAGPASGDDEETGDDDDADDGEGTETGDQAADVSAPVEIFEVEICNNGIDDDGDGVVDEDDGLTGIACDVIGIENTTEVPESADEAQQGEQVTGNDTDLVSVECDPGFVLDPATGECVPIETPPLDGPDEQCLFDPSLPHCVAVDGKCPGGFAINVNEQCYPTGPCPDGYNKVDDDETGACYPDEAPPTGPANQTTITTNQTTIANQTIETVANQTITNQTITNQTMLPPPPPPPTPSGPYNACSQGG